MPTDLTHLLTPEDAARYEKHLAGYQKIWKPVGEHEEVLVQALAGVWWRLQRLPGLEEALYAKGARELKDKVAELAPEARPAMVRLETYLLYEKQFRNLALQERRLAKHAAELKAELETTQKTRDRQEAEHLAHAAKLYHLAKKEGRTYDPEADGFEFSLSDLEDYFRGQRAATVSSRAA